LRFFHASGVTYRYAIQQDWHLQAVKNLIRVTLTEESMIYNLWLWKNNPTTNRLFASMTDEETKAMQANFTEEAMARRNSAWELYCECAWANEEYRNWGLVRYDSIQDRQRDTKEITQAGWFNYGDMVSLLGIPQMPNGGGAVKPDFPDPLYQLWIMRANPTALANYMSLSKDQEAELWGKWQESVKRTGACMMLNCISAWCDEQRPGFGVMAYPSMEARIEHVADTQKLHWGLYGDAFTILGKAI
jgi:hypothetical protein